MKRLLLFITIISISFGSFASHTLGGSVSWRCLPNGKYIFQMEIYRDCSGASWSFHNETLDIVGNPLPRDTFGNTISSISLLPDSSRWTMSNFGDLSPNCDTSIGSRFSCANGDNGVAQLFYYQSAPIELNGVAPSTGWNIYWQGVCCRPVDFANVNASGKFLLLRAIMYPDALGSASSPCIDSSPEFRALPVASICRGQELTFNHSAIDNDLDSLVYKWDRPLDTPISNPRFVSYNNGFSPNNPTPDQNFNINNVPSSLDALTGIIRMAIFNGIGVEKYLTVVRVDAYRKGQRIASVFREMPITVFDCPDLAGLQGTQNTAPQVFIDGIPYKDIFILNVTAGQSLTGSIQVVDNDRLNTAPFQQQLTMLPEGTLFTSSRNGPSQNFPTDSIGEPCDLSNAAAYPCAYLQNIMPSIDTTTTPAVPTIQGLGTINTELIWQTDCKHIQNINGFPGTNEGIYNFVLRVQDDHCPNPSISYPTITVRVRDPLPLTYPIIKGISVNLDGTTTYSWVPPIDSANQFNPAQPADDHYQVQSSKVTQNQVPNFFVTLNPKLKKYKQASKSPNFSPYELNNQFDPNSGYNILRPDGSNVGFSFDYYVRMRTLSGCTDANASYWSEPARIIELGATPTGGGNPRDSIQLNWNRAKPITAKTYPYFNYESPTHFYIYANDSISNGGVADSSNWYLTGYTMDTNLLVSTSNCADYSAYRVESRDTIITLKGGSALENSRYFTGFDTLYFSTFSTVDSIFTTGGAPSVLNVGNQYLQSSVQREKYQWIDCATNQPLINDTQFTFTPTTPGFYKVVATNSNCSDTSSCIEVKPVEDTIFSVGIQNLEAKVQGVVINWLNCADSSIVRNASASYVPTKPGSYRVSYQKFGFPISYSDCFTVAPLDSTVVQYQFDSFEAKDSMAHYQWYQKLSQVDILLPNERNRTIVPRSAGRYFAELSKYGFSKTSEEVFAPELNTNVHVVSNQELLSADTGKSYIWKDCNADALLFSQRNQNLLLTDTGSFAVRVRAFNYWEYSDCIRMNAVGLSENSFQSQLNYYPNPTNGLVQIDFKQVQQNVAVEVYSIQGKLVQNQRIQNSESIKIELNQPAGIYFIQLINEKGERANLKIVKS